MKSKALLSAYAAALPATGFLRISQIVGNPKSNPPIPPLIPICSASWWNGVRSGKYPKAVKIGPHTTAWRVEDIRELISKMATENNLPKKEMSDA